MDQTAMDPGLEARLVGRARWGGQDAFAQLYGLHARAVYSLALRLTGNTATAEDITQEAFLKMLGFLGGFRENAPLRPWLKRVTANLAIDRLRRDRRRASEPFDDEHGDELGFDTAGAQDTHTEASHLLRRLPPLARTLLWLHEMEGWSHSELGRRFGRSESWSKSIVSRALSRLRAELEEERANERT